MTISIRFAGISAAALLIAASFVTVTAAPSFAADRGIGVVAKKKSFPVILNNDKIVEANTDGGFEKTKKNLKFLVKEDKPEIDAPKTKFFAPEDKPVSEPVVQDDKPRTKFLVEEDKPAKPRKPRILAEDKIDNSLGIADLGGRDFDVADGEDEPVSKPKIKAKKKPVAEEETDENASTDSGEPKEAVEDPDTEEKQAAEDADTEEAPVVKKKKVAKKKVIEPEYEDNYSEYDAYEVNTEYDNGGYNQSYSVNYGGGYSNCH
jgi:hypothetical protein